MNEERWQPETSRELDGIIIESGPRAPDNETIPLLIEDPRPTKVNLSLLAAYADATPTSEDYLSQPRERVPYNKRRWRAADTFEIDGTTITVPREVLTSALSKAKHEYDRLSGTSTPKDECWAEFEALAEYVETPMTG